jgi:putative NIF3 family GTP cyclohydrolase 1 type 2
MNKTDLTAYLNEYLNISNFDDTSKNGLQIDNEKSEIKKIAYAVDASTYIFDKAIEEKVDMVLVHHGIFW